MHMRSGKAIKKIRQQPLPISVKSVGILGVLKILAYFHTCLVQVAHSLYNFIERDAIWDWGKER